MTYVNTHTGEKYQGGILTINYNGVLFIGVPTETQLKEFGYEEYVPDEKELKLSRMGEIEAELKSMDYLTSKELDGEDMTKYNERFGGDYKLYRRNLRAEYNKIEEEISLLSEEEPKSEEVPTNEELYEEL